MFSNSNLNDIILGEDQEKAIDLIKNFIKSSDTAFNLQGVGGTGKTMIINYVCNLLEQQGINYVLCAPTHKAALVLERYTQRDAITLHKLMSLSPNIDILNLDFRDLIFKIPSSTPEFPYHGVVICDEASMINDDLFKMLETKCKEFNSKVIFSGDKQQLQPVKSRTVSLVYNLENSFTLKKIYRQSGKSALIDTLQTLRETSMPRLVSSEGEDGSIFCTSKINEFLKECLTGIKRAISKSDILESKILAYTNDRVYSYNNSLRKFLWENDNQYNKFEFLTAYENLEYNSIKFYNSMDYIIISEPKKFEVFIPDFMPLPAYSFQLYDSLNKCSDEICILDKDIDEEYFKSLAYKIESLRLNAIETSKINKWSGNKLWQRYFKIMQSFTTPIDLMFDNRVIRKKSFDYGYAMTVHRSQGSSINNTYIDWKNINLCSDEEIRRQLQYVALSRTRKNAYIYQ